MTTTTTRRQPVRRTVTTKEKGLTPGRVWVGVDTHQRTHHAAVIDDVGRVVADAQFAATGAGFAALTGWAASFGDIVAAGVEQTGTYGAGLTRHLVAAGVAVVEVNRPDVAVRAAQGKTDQLDAVMAARAVQSGRAGVIPKNTNGISEAIRNLHVVRESAVKQRTATISQLRDVITTAPQDVREDLLPRTRASRVKACAALEPAGDVVHVAVMTSLRSLAERIQSLDAEIKAIGKQHDALVRRAAPTLLGLRQVGPQVAARMLITAGQNPDRLRSESSFARLCGVAPIPASSGKTTRYRLHRGGDRQANRALYLVATGRMKDHPPTLAYVQRKTAPDGTIDAKHVIRCLKRYVARELYQALKTDLAALDRP